MMKTGTSSKSKDRGYKRQGQQGATRRRNKEIMAQLPLLAIVIFALLGLSTAESALDVCIIGDGPIVRK
jgi:hypothetical protein